MPTILFADNFLAGSVLSLLMPVCLLIAIALWYVRLAKRAPETHPASSRLPSSEVVAAGADAADRVEPAGPPPGEIR
jgi:hypothetical protein